MVELEHNRVINAARITRSIPQIFHHACMVRTTTHGIAHSLLCALALHITGVVCLFDAMMALATLRAQAAPA
jgi:hypothetical protein